MGAQAGRPEVGAAISVRLGAGLLARTDGYAARRGLSRAQAVRRLIAAGLRAPDDYGIWHTSGEPYGDAQHRYTPAQAALIAASSPWAAIDDDGDLVIGEHRSRASWGGGSPVPGAELAARLRGE